MFVFLLIVSLVAVSCQDSDAVDDGANSPTTDDEVSPGPISDPTGQYEDIQKKVDLIPNIIDPETGEVNKKTFDFGMSKADERIAEINKFLEENASWMKFILRMVPEISWLFFWNVIIILFFFTHMVLNAGKYGFFSEEGMARIAGFGIFAILLLLDLYYYLAQLWIHLLDAFFNYVLPWGIVIAVILIVVLIVVMLALLFFAPTIFINIMGIFRRLAGEKMMSEAARKAGGGDVQKIAKEGSREVGKLKEARERIEEFEKGAGI